MLFRSAHSAKALGIPFDLLGANHLLEETSKKLRSNYEHRVRLDLSPDGELSISSTPLEALSPSVKLFWANEILANDYSADQLTMRSHNPLLLHKVTQRSVYDAAWQKAVSLGGFDALFTNERGHVTEGGRTSIFIRGEPNGEWLTQIGRAHV